MTRRAGDALPARNGGPNQCKDRTATGAGRRPGRAPPP